MLQSNVGFCGADQGDAIAESNLGIMYAKGQGVPKDYAEAAKWFRLAADQGDAAQSNLGAMYANGHGVPQDYVQAHMWLNVAASGYLAHAETEERDEAVKYRDLIASKIIPCADGRGTEASA